MTDYDFWQNIRRALLMIANALQKRYGFDGLIILLGKDRTE